MEIDLEKMIEKYERKIEGIDENLLTFKSMDSYFVGLREGYLRTLKDLYKMAGVDND